MPNTEAQPAQPLSEAETRGVALAAGPAGASPAMSPRNRLREALKAAPDGVTNGELSKLTGIDPSQVTKSLRIMPDAYIDRWMPSSAPGGWSAIWVMAEIPEDCPKPTIKYHAKDSTVNLRVVSPPNTCRFD